MHQPLIAASTACGYAHHGGDALAFTTYHKQHAFGRLTLLAYVI